VIDRHARGFATDRFAIDASGTGIGDGAAAGASEMSRARTFGAATTGARGFMRVFGARSTGHSSAAIAAAAAAAGGDGATRALLGCFAGAGLRASGHSSTVGAAMIGASRTAATFAIDFARIDFGGVGIACSGVIISPALAAARTALSASRARTRVPRTCTRPGIPAAHGPQYRAVFVPGIPYDGITFSHFAHILRLRCTHSGVLCSSQR